MNKKTIKKVISTSLTAPAYSSESVKTMKPVLSSDPNNNYLDKGIIARILRWPQYQPVIHWVTIAVFLIIIYSGLTNGSKDKTLNNGLLSMIIVMGVYTTAGLWILTLPVLG